MTNRHRLSVRRNTSNDRLARELSEFRSQAELAELAALLNRHSDDETAELRELVNWTAAA